LALEAAGAYGVVLEMVPALLAKEITERLSVHTVGIGAGPHTDAQVLVFHDVVGLYGEFKPRFVKRYLEAGAARPGGPEPVRGRGQGGGLPGRGAQLLKEPGKGAGWPLK
jgi:hypothetical protein